MIGKLAVAGIAAILFPTLALAQLPVADATFAIDSAKAADKLKSAKASLETALTVKIAEAAHDRFGFLTWNAAKALKPGEIPSRPRLTIVFRQVAVADGAEYNVVYASSLGGAAPRVLAIGNPRPLYPALQPGKPLSNPDNRLRDDILARVCEDLDAFREPLMKLFLSQIALSRTPPQVVSSNKMFITDLPWKDLNAGRGSVLFVDFHSRRPDTDVICDGDINLSNLQPAIGGAPDSMVRARFEQFHYPFFDHTLKEGEWNPKISVILDSMHVQTLTIYMTHYDTGTGGTSSGPRSTVHN